MTSSPSSTAVRCKLCGYVFPGGWLRVFNEPHASLFLHHLSAMHRDEVKPLLDRMRTEDIGATAMKAFAWVEDAELSGPSYDT
jgi:hypothetical protein